MIENPEIIDCFKVDLIKDIPEEINLLIRDKNQLITQNQKLKKAIWALSITLGGVLLYVTIKDYGKKKSIKKQ